MFGYEPHAHLLFAYEFFCQHQNAIAGNRWKKEKCFKRHVTP
jgi:hypothetical protein